MDAAIRTALEKFRDRRRIAQRFQELDLGIGEQHEHGGHAVLGLRDRGGYFSAERVAVDARGFGDVPHRDRHVVEPSDVHFVCFL